MEQQIGVLFHTKNKLASNETENIRLPLTRRYLSKTNKTAIIND